MAIERRESGVKFRLCVYVKFDGEKMYLGTFEDSPYGLSLAEQCLLNAKQLIAEFKQRVKDSDPWSTESVSWKAELLSALKGMKDTVVVDPTDSDKKEQNAMKKRLTPDEAFRAKYQLPADPKDQD